LTANIGDKLMNNIGCKYWWHKFAKYMNMAMPSNILCDSWSGDNQMKKKLNCIKCQSKTTDMMAAADMQLI